MKPRADAEWRAPQRGSSGVPPAVFRTGRSAPRLDRVQASRLRHQGVQSELRPIPTPVARPWECPEPEPTSRHGLWGYREGEPDLRHSTSRFLGTERAADRLRRPPHRPEFWALHLSRRVAFVARDRANPSNRTSVPEDTRRVPNCNP